ncbi:MAG: trans-sulfuration enzyme family protein [Lysobacteraceae bacterium]
MRLETLAVHAGAEPDAATGALSPPLHLATTFLHAPDGALDHGFLYQRDDNPTQQRLEAALAALDRGERALFLATGMAAAATLLQALEPGGRVVFQSDLYHGVRDLARDWLPRWGLQAGFVDATDTDAVRAALAGGAACLWVESPSNPLMQVVDIAALAALAHEAGARLVVDGTFATPVLQQPLALGADVVMHSATKYIGGHSDLMGGALVFARDDALAQRCRQVRKLHGGTASPFNAWMALRGLRSLPARMRVHCDNARQLAQVLADHPKVEAVHYPGLASHPGHAVAARQMRDFGGMLSLQVEGGREAAMAVLERLRLFHCATSLGGCESLVEHRASVEGTHPVSPENLLRVSVGLEHGQDLVEDMQQALG